MPSGIPLTYQALTFAFFELSLDCDRFCVQCYNESGPQGDEQDAKRRSISIKSFMTHEKWRQKLIEVYQLGCRRLQFTGGEATLVSFLPDMIVAARILGFELVEVFTNCSKPPSEVLLRCFIKNDVRIATSYYSNDPKRHQAITRRDDRASTVETIKIYINAGLKVRIGFIEMEANKGDYADSFQFLVGLGVKPADIGYDAIRSIGRGTNEKQIGTPQAPCDEELCGSCPNGKIAITGSGHVAPCVFCRTKPVGSAVMQTLEEIMTGSALAQRRLEIFEVACKKRGCGPQDPCDPENPCSPDDQCAPDDADACVPTQLAYKLADRSTCEPLVIAVSAYARLDGWREVRQKMADCNPTPCNPDPCDPAYTPRPPKVSRTGMIASCDPACGPNCGPSHNPCTPDVPCAPDTSCRPPGRAR
jgi:MoaA/NifB/PqqE/SkfB family radical SAM enzyme